MEAKKKEAAAVPAGIKVVVQRVEEAFLLVDNVNDWVHISKGLIFYVSFLKSANSDILPKMVKTLLNSPLSIDKETGRTASLIETHGHILLVPQASLSGKLKGNKPQYHGQIAKEEGAVLYQNLIELIKEEIKGDDKIVFKWGVYGNTQGLRFTSDGPFTHQFDF